jgi:hypothetical protein
MKIIEPNRSESITEQFHSWGMSLALEAKLFDVFNAAIQRAIAAATVNDSRTGASIPNVDDKVCVDRA